MLQHQPNEVTPEPSVAAQTRVTSDELTRAIAALQAKKEQEARRFEGTISLGEAIDQLHLQMTPEEILAEVKALRTAVRPRRRMSPKVRMVLWLVFALLLAWPIVNSLVGDLSVNSSVEDPSSNTSVSAQPQTVRLNLIVQDLTPQGPILKTLSEVPDDHAVRCMLNSNDFRDFTSPTDSWILIKHQGKVYVRGWTVKMSDNALRQGTCIRVYNSPQPSQLGAMKTQITLPIGQFKLSDGADMGGGVDIGFSATDVHPDAHAWEPWQ